MPIFFPTTSTISETTKLSSINTTHSVFSKKKKKIGCQARNKRCIVLTIRNIQQLNQRTSNTVFFVRKSFSNKKAAARLVAGRTCFDSAINQADFQRTMFFLVLEYGLKRENVFLCFFRKNHNVCSSGSVLRCHSNRSIAVCDSF